MIVCNVSSIFPMIFVLSNIFKKKKSPWHVMELKTFPCNLTPFVFLIKPMANLYNAPKKFNKEYIDMIQILLISINK
jgi:hypothetical protein